jgi:NADPH-dependent 2,4-dienoyl-CoA reductase/sulfur reductase-like enzyme
MRLALHLVSDRVVVIGGDAGGMAAVSQIRKLRPYAEIVVLERGAWTSYSACGIPYVVGGEVAPLERLQVRTPQQFRDNDRVDVRLRHEVKSIDLDRRNVEVWAHEQGRAFQMGFDQLLIATGGSPIRPALPGIELPTVHNAHTLDHARALLGELDAGRALRVVVVGGGYIGLEMAEAFAHRGARTTLVEGADQLMSTFDADMTTSMTDTLRAAGVEVVLSTRVSGFEPDGVVTAVGKIPCDIVVLGIGVRPNSALAGAAGLRLGARHAIAVNRRQQISSAEVSAAGVSVDGIYAAGDCCESTHLVSGHQVHIALGTVANKQARVAGINIGGGYATFPGVVGTAISKICSLEVARTGLSEREAAAAGFAAVASTITSTTRAGYYPDAASITVKLVVERRTGRLLGGQIVGGQGAGKRIDTLALAVTAGFDVQQLLDADLAYAPPFSPVWDPVQVAAREALKLV